MRLFKRTSDAYCRRAIARTILTVLAAAIVCGAPAQVMGQKKKPSLRIVDTIWGFDGRIQAGQFNPVSVLLDNTTGDAVDGTVILQQQTGVLGVSGVSYQAPLFIGPNGRRWVQLYPYLAQAYNTSWRITVLDRNSGKRLSPGELPQFRATPDQSSNQQYKLAPTVSCVALLASDSSTRPPAKLKKFPEEIFPPYSTATSSLHSVFLDHQPDWEEPRRQAFLSWLKCGGQVHLLKNRRGEYPDFDGTLAPLNQPMTRFEISSGVVQKHNLAFTDLTDDRYEQILQNGLVYDRRVQVKELDEVEDFQSNNYYPTTSSSLDYDMYRQMQERTQPDHAWWLIFILAFLYVFLIFPGCYLLSKNRKLHFLTTYAAIAGLSVVFSLIFLFIGRRGYGESTWLQTLAMADVTTDGELSIQQWNSLFVTNGDNYMLNSPDTQSLFTAGADNDNTSAVITAGKEGSATVRIPPYSSQPLASARFVKGTPWDVELVDSEFSGDQLVRFQLKVGEGFPKEVLHSKYYVIVGNRISTLNYNKTSGELTLFGARQALQDFCRSDQSYMFGWQSSTYDTNDDRSVDEIYLDKIVPLLVQRSLMTDNVDQPRYFQMPPGRFRLLVVTKMPQEMDVSVSQEVRHTGWILYTHDITTQ